MGHTFRKLDIYGAQHKIPHTAGRCVRVTWKS